MNSERGPVKGGIPRFVEPPRDFRPPPYRSSILGVDEGKNTHCRFNRTTKISDYGNLSRINKIRFEEARDGRAYYHA